MKKFILTLLFAIILMPVLSVGAETVEREITVYLNRDYSDCVFYVSWENSEKTASVRLKDPDGGEVKVNGKDSDFGKGFVRLKVGNAKSGNWSVSVSGDDLGVINVSGGSIFSGNALTDNIIKSFSAEISGENIKFNWEVSGIAEAYNAEILQSQNDADYHTVYSDTKEGGKGLATVPRSDFLTGLYKFTLRISDGDNIYSLSTDDAVYIKQDDAPAKLENIKIGSIDGEFYASWDQGENSEFLVTMYDSNTMAVISSEEVRTNFYEIPLEEDTEKIKFSVAAAGWRVIGDFDVYDIVRSVPEGIVTFPSESAVNGNSFFVRFDCAAEVKGGIYVDGTKLCEDEAPKEYNLMLADGSHEVVAYIEDTNGNVRSFTKRITVDKTPPEISLNNTDVTKTASDSAIITGYTEPNATVMINGVEQKQSDGSFTAKVKLKDGENPFTVTVYDEVGNMAVKTVVFQKTASLDNTVIMLVIPAAIFVFLTVWYIILNVNSKKKAEAVVHNEKGN